nr:protein hook like 1 [Quercus suber]
MLGASLLQWIASFDPAPLPHSDWHDLSDGRVLWHILHDVDVEYFAGSLPEPEVTAAADWTRKWQNLKHVAKQVATYYRDVCSGQDDAGAAYAPDTQAIAAETSVQDLEKLIMLIIRAAMASPECNQRMGQRLMSLGRDSALAIASEMRRMQEVVEYEAESESVSRDESAYQSEQEMEQKTPVRNATNGKKDVLDSYSDPLLEREEELLQAHATIDKLQASQEAAQSQLRELRQDKEKLQEALDAYRAEIDTKGRKPVADDSYKKLQRQSDNDRAYIDDLEGQLQSSRDRIENYEKQLERQRAENDVGLKLRDDLQLLRAENEDLQQKIKANDNLKKKIQTLQEHEKTNASLRDELKQANERLEDLDRLKQFQSSLEKEIIEKKGLIRNQEYQISELTTTRKAAEYDSRLLAQKLQDARERHDRDHEAIEELRAKLGEADLDDEVDDGPVEQTKKVDEEQSAKPKVARNDENKHLVDKLALLQQQLEAADARLKQAAERNATLEDQRRTNDAETSAYKKAQRQLEENEALVVELRRQLEAAPAKATPAPPQDIAVLQRENQLMTSAWYDLASRMQNNGVSLGRRRQEPKSWIARQRALVGPGAGGSGISR